MRKTLYRLNVRGKTPKDPYNKLFFHLWRIGDIPSYSSIPPETEFDTQYTYFAAKGIYYLQRTSYRYVQDDDGTYRLQEDVMTNVYDSNTNTLTEEFSDFKKGNITNENAQAFAAFCIAVACSNQYVNNALIEAEFTQSTSRRYGFSQTFAHKLYTLMTKRHDLLEQIVKTNPNLLGSQSLEDLDVEQKNVKQSVGIPKTALKVISDNGLQGCVGALQAIDPNDTMILCELIEALRPMFGRKGSTRRGLELTPIIDTMAKILREDLGYGAKEGVNYLLRQTMNHSLWSAQSMAKIAQTFYDYAVMRKEHGIGEKFPPNVIEAHDLMTRNIKAINAGLEDKFVAAVQSYKGLETTISVKDGPSYIFSVPQKTKDLVEEGANLHHCVASYAKRIALGKTIVVFMRLAKTPTESLVTLEVSLDKKIVQAKENFNNDVTDTQLNRIISRYQKFLDKKTTI